MKEILYRCKLCNAELKSMAPTPFGGLLLSFECGSNRLLTSKGSEHWTHSEKCYMYYKNRQELLTNRYPDLLERNKIENTLPQRAREREEWLEKRFGN